MDGVLYRVCKFMAFVVPLLIVATLICGLYFQILSICVTLIITVCGIISEIVSISVILLLNHMRQMLLNKWLPRLF